MDNGLETLTHDASINRDQLRDIVAFSFKRILMEFYVRRSSLEEVQTPSPAVVVIDNTPGNESSLSFERYSRASRIPHQTISSDAFHQTAVRVHNVSAEVVYTLQRSSILCKLCVNHMLHKTLASINLLREHMTSIMDSEEEFIAHPPNSGIPAQDAAAAASPVSPHVPPRFSSSLQYRNRLSQVTTLALECLHNLEDCLDVYDLYGLNEFDPYFRLTTRTSVRWSIPDPASEMDLFESFLRSPGMCMPSMQPQTPPVNAHSQTEFLTSIEQATNIWVWRFSLIFLLQKLAETLEEQIGVDCFRHPDTLSSFCAPGSTQLNWSTLIQRDIDGVRGVDTIQMPNCYVNICAYTRNLYEVLRACLGARERVSLLYWVKRNFTD